MLLVWPFSSFVCVHNKGESEMFFVVKGCDCYDDAGPGGLVNTALGRE